MTRRQALLSVMLAALLGAPLPAAAQPADEYALNRDTSVVGFTVYARMLFKVPKEGRFKKIDGELSFDPAALGATHVDLTVYTASVDMKNTEHEALLRSGDFFDVDHFPTMHFVSQGAQRRPDGTFDVTGDLTIRDVTRRIAIPVRIKPTEQAGAKAAIFETTFDIDRTEFGLNGNAKAAGMNVSIAKNVQIRIAIAGVARRPGQPAQ